MFNRTVKYYLKVCFQIFFLCLIIFHLLFQRLLSSNGVSEHVYSNYSNGKTMAVPRRRHRMNYLLYLVILVLFIGIMITCINVYELKQIHRDHVGLGTPLIEGEAEGSSLGQSKALWVWGKKVSLLTYL